MHGFRHLAPQQSHEKLEWVDKYPERAKQREPVKAITYHVASRQITSWPFPRRRRTQDLSRHPPDGRGYCARMRYNSIRDLEGDSLGYGLPIAAEAPRRVAGARRSVRTQVIPRLEIEKKPSTLFTWASPRTCRPGAAGAGALGSTYDGSVPLKRLPFPILPRLWGRVG